MKYLVLLIQSLRGLINGLILILNTTFWGLPVMLLGMIKLSSENDRWQHFWTGPIVWLCSCWADVCLLVERSIIRIKFEITREGEVLSRDNSYLVICNHQSTADIPVLMEGVHENVPFMRFFAKAELKKLPIFGMAWRSVDCPFMHRYSKEFLEKNPHLRGKDLLKTIESCRRLRFGPAAVTNFLEGTRLTPKKHAQQDSPYDHLLLPRAGGVALAISALEGQLKTLVDVTLWYHQPNHELWDYLCGRVKKISIHVRTMPIPEHFPKGDYQNDPEFKAEFQSWLNKIWQEKDERLKAWAKNDSEARSV